jgi:DNA-binding response OmpR family regulator
MTATTTRTVLLVDDDPVIVCAIRTVLENRGYRVVTAEDGNNGLAVAEQEAPDLVICDMMMPKKSGLIVLEKLRSRKERCPRIIMITANEGRRHQDYATYLGVDDFLRKPFDLARLMESVGRLCPLPVDSQAN